MRVCFVIDMLEIGGTENQLLMLIRHLDRSRVIPYLCLLRENDSETARAIEPNDCEVLHLTLGSLSSGYCLKQAIRFRSFLKSHKINLLQAFFLDSTFFAAMVGKVSGIKVFGSKRNMGDRLSKKNMRREKYLGHYFLDKIIANAESCKKAVVAQADLKPENVVVIPNGIEMDRFKSISVWEPNQEKTVKTIGAVGNLKPVKGTDVLINAAKLVLDRIPDCRFQVAGSIDHEGYDQHIESLDLSERFTLCGRTQDAPNFLRTLDIAVLPSRSEGLSNSLLEYMAAGRPIVATDVGGNGELIRHGENGLLVPSDNPQKLADAMIELLENPEKAANLARNARTCIEDRFDADQVAAKYCDLYEKAFHIC